MSAKGKEFVRYVSLYDKASIVLDAEIYTGEVVAINEKGIEIKTAKGEIVFGVWGKIMGIDR
ncbi:hypothetical protein [Priestia megaterium]|uniref:hypothetical protein n=1 Tax=Priestia megaterium TaxID=1404 RepID=UPI00287749AC|nr:hypothetical protein [Priestia megaterium]